MVGGEKTAGGFALLFLAYALFLVDMRIRYILSIVPPLVILAVYGVFNLYLRIKRPVYLFAALMFFGGLAWHLSREIFSGSGAARLSSGAVSRDAYLARMLPEYTSFQYMPRTRRRMRKFIFSLSAGERIIASEIIFMTAASCRDICWRRFAELKAPIKSNKS